MLAAVWPKRLLTFEPPNPEKAVAALAASQGKVETQNPTPPDNEVTLENFPGSRVAPAGTASPKGRVSTKTSAGEGTIIRRGIVCVSIEKLIFP
jgi:hypothetical protein